MKTASKRSVQSEESEEQVMDLVLDSVSRYFRLLSEPMRLKIIRSICESEKSVSEIVEETGANQANVSRHLSLLFNAGVLSRRKEANFVLYSVSDQTLTEICRTVCNRMALQFSSETENRQGAINLAGGFGTSKSS